MSTPSIAAGRIFAKKYRLVRPLGEGGMGSVWEAMHLSLGTAVAIKLIDPALLNNAEVLMRFSHEAKATAALRCENVVQIYDHDVCEGQPYIVLERLEGETLAERLGREQRLDPLVTLRILSQVARVAELGRRVGVVHRDLKPSNVFLLGRSEQSERVKVLDFGVAMLCSMREPSDLHKPGRVVGTPWYMSPEQARGSFELDHTTDLWAIAVMAFECLTGRLPFDDESMKGLLGRICATERPDSGLIGFGEAFDNWFRKATACEPKHRFQTAAELIAGLRAVVLESGSEEVTASSSPSDRTLRSAGVPDITIAGSVRSAPPARQSRSWLRSALVAAGVLSALGLGASSLALPSWLVSPLASTATPWADALGLSVLPSRALSSNHDRPRNEPTKIRDPSAKGSSATGTLHGGRSAAVDENGIQVFPVQGDVNEAPLFIASASASTARAFTPSSPPPPARGSSGGTMSQQSSAESAPPAQHVAMRSPAERHSEPATQPAAPERERDDAGTLMTIVGRRESPEPQTTRIEALDDATLDELLSEREVDLGI